MASSAWPPATYLPRGVPEALQEEHILLHVVSKRLAQGLDQRGAHRALGTHAPQELPQRLPLAPPVVAEWREGDTPPSLSPPPLPHHHHHLPGLANPPRSQHQSQTPNLSPRR